MVRPDGSEHRLWAWILGAGGAFLFSGTFMIDATNPESAALNWALTVLSSLAISVAILLAVVGSIVHAIWFLPGREIPEEELPNRTSLTGYNEPTPSP
jgi:hypothetical protein